MKVIETAKRFGREARIARNDAAVEGDREGVITAMSTRVMLTLLIIAISSAAASGADLLPK